MLAAAACPLVDWLQLKEWWCASCSCMPAVRAQRLGVTHKASCRSGRKICSASSSPPPPKCLECCLPPCWWTLWAAKGDFLFLLSSAVFKQARHVCCRRHQPLCVCPSLRLCVGMMDSPLPGKIFVFILRTFQLTAVGAICLGFHLPSVDSTTQLLSYPVVSKRVFVGAFMGVSGVCVVVHQTHQFTPCLTAESHHRSYSAAPHGSRGTN